MDQSATREWGGCAIGAAGHGAWLLALGVAVCLVVLRPPAEWAASTHAMSLAYVIGAVLLGSSRWIRSRRRDPLLALAAVALYGAPLWWLWGGGGADDPVRPTGCLMVALLVMLSWIWMFGRGLIPMLRHGWKDPSAGRPD